jgi:flagellin
VSLKINTNIAAMTAMRHLSKTEGMMENVVTRLSTGLRINSAGDDPAGLIISESLRSQIKGIEQATRNTQDAVNLSKTAEGAMAEVSSLLTNIRALAVHSANTATVDAFQLEANQSQIRSTIQSINRIAEQTSWGTKKLLNGASGVVSSVTATTLASSLYIGSEAGGERVRTGAVNVTRTTQATQTTTGNLATSFAATTTVVNQGTFVINGTTFTVQPGTTVSQLVDRINQESSITGVTATLSGSGPYFVQLTSNRYGSQFPINYFETSNILNGGNPSTPPVGADAVFSVEIPIEPSGTVTETFTGGLGPGVDGLTLVSPSGNRLVLTPLGNATAGPSTIGQVTVGSMRFQIGANSEQTVVFSLPSLYASELGKGIVPGQDLSTIDVTSQQGALDAIRIIDAAIKELALIRGNLGSFQRNFLESTVRSLDVSRENLTASESQIRDADMAVEMTELTKTQILRQSGIAVLAQASQAPQAVLQLLRQ